MVQLTLCFNKLKKILKKQLHQIKNFTKLNHTPPPQKTFSPLLKLKPIKQVIYLFNLLGRPFYLLILIFILAISNLVNLIFSSLDLIKRIKLTNNLKISLPSFPKLSLSSLPKISLPTLKITLPSFKITLPKLSQIKTPSLPQIKPFKPSKRFFIYFSLFLSLTGLIYLQILKDLPSPHQLKNNNLPLSTQIYDRNGELLFTFYNDQNRQLTKLNNIPQHVIDATLATEDEKFYQHQGLSVSGILRAIKHNLTDNQLQGGSTITQQLIKNTLLNNKKTLTRKLKEVILAIHTELIFDKKTILSMYFNHIPYGGPVYGIEAASHHYFNKTVQDLNLSEAALLAGLPQAPTKYSPFSHPQKAKARQITVLKRMLKEQLITQDQYQQAIEAPLKYNPNPNSIKAPHFVMYVYQKLTDQYNPQVIAQGGLKITTTLDLKIQNQAEEILKEELEKLKNLNVNNGATLITDPQSGQILAMVGSKDYFDPNIDGQVNITTSLRQPGSAIKPINYALAFEKGFTPSTTIEDAPIAFRLPNQKTWTPRNYDNKFHGKVTLRTALASSYNIPAIKLLNRNGISQMVLLAQKMGIDTWNDPSRYGLSLTLGSNEVKMTDLAEVYGTFANLGNHVELTPIISIKNSNNQPLQYSPCPNSKCQPNQVINPSTAFLINDVLSDPQARAPAFGYNSILNIPQHQVAVKTGTSNNLRDNWTIGYTSDQLVVTWVGNNDNTPMSKVASGITGASPIWAKTINLSLQDRSTAHQFSSPETIVKVAICPLTNTLTCEACPNPKLETFATGTQPKTACTQKQIKAIITPQTTPSNQPLAETKKLPPAISTTRQ